MFPRRTDSRTPARANGWFRKWFLPAVFLAAGGYFVAAAGALMEHGHPLRGVAVYLGALALFSAGVCLLAREDR